MKRFFDEKQWSKNIAWPDFKPHNLFYLLITSYNIHLSENNTLRTQTSFKALDVVSGFCII